MNTKKISIILLLIITLVIPAITMASSTCTPVSTTIVSNTNTIVVTGSEDQNAVLASKSNYWTSISGASWIWKTFQTENPNINQTYTFKNTFTFEGEVNNSTLEIASDDYFTAEINNTGVASEFGEGNFLSAKTYDVTDLIKTGVNEISVNGTNAAYFYSGEGTAENNPAGVIFSLHVDGETCTEDTKSTVVGSRNSGGGTIETPSKPEEVKPTVNSSEEILGVTDTYKEPSKVTTVNKSVNANDDTATTTDSSIETLSRNNLAASAFGAFEGFDISWRCILIALVIILTIYIVGELIYKKENSEKRKLVFYTIAVILTILILAFVFTCPIIPLFTLYVILSVLTYSKII